MTQLSLRTDEELVALYASGENSAFDILLARYKDKLYSYILYLVHNSDVADDLFQDTFVRAIMTIRQGKYTESGKFYPRIAHNLIIDQFRQEKNENAISNDEVDSDLFNNARFSDKSIEQQIIDQQTLCDLSRLMEHLPETQKEMVHLRYYKNLSFKEIADMQGVSINTALGRMHYAIINMRRMAKENNISLTIG